MLSWLRDRRRHAVLAEPFPDAWRDVLRANVFFYASLPDEQRETLEDLLRLFRAEKHWEGVRGLAMTEEIQVTIAAQACLLLLARPPGAIFPRVESVIVYPSAYVGRQRRREEAGYITEMPTPQEGQIATTGGLVLSWDDVLAGGRNTSDGHNVVFHEFAHELDLEEGEFNGVPRLDTDAQAETWARVMTAEYQRLVADIAAGHPSVLDPYGATNAAEFFAVATEVFFERATALWERHPDLYGILCDFYRQDPAARPR